MPGDAPSSSYPLCGPAWTQRGPAGRAAQAAPRAAVLVSLSPGPALGGPHLQPPALAWSRWQGEGTCVGPSPQEIPPSGVPGPPLAACSLLRVLCPLTGRVPFLSRASASSPGGCGRSPSPPRWPLSPCSRTCWLSLALSGTPAPHSPVGDGGQPTLGGTCSPLLCGVRAVWTSPFPLLGAVLGEGPCPPAPGHRRGRQTHPQRVYIALHPDDVLPPWSQDTGGLVPPWGLGEAGSQGGALCPMGGGRQPRSRGYSSENSFHVVQPQTRDPKRFPGLSHRPSPARSRGPHEPAATETKDGPWSPGALCKPEQTWD